MLRLPINVSLALLQMLAVLLPGISVAQGHPSRFPLTAAAVAEVIGRQGIYLTPDQIDLPLLLTAGVSDPRLRVSGAELLPGDRVRVRIACASSRECLPFFASFHFDKTASSSEILATLNSSSTPEQPIKSEGTTVLRPGDHAVLLMEGDHMRISLPVVTIDSGKVGSEIRVSSLDHKHLYQGRVLSAEIIKGRLP